MDPKSAATGRTDQPPSRDLVLVVVNRSSGAVNRKPLVDALVTGIQEAGWDCRIVAQLDQLGGVLDAVPRSALRGVVAAGGDGTVNAVAERLPDGVPLLVFPMGTENLLATSLGLQACPRLLVETLQRGRTKQLDVGMANGRPFLIVASAGFDADVVRRIHLTRKGNVWKLQYVAALFASLWAYRFPPLRLRWGDLAAPHERHEATAAWFFSFLIPRYAMGLPFLQKAPEQDGRIDGCYFPRGGILRGLGYFLSLLLRQHHRWTGFKQFRATWIEIESDQPVAYQIDGEYAGELPLRLEIASRTVAVQVPHSS
ncbi:MAG: diacylglycerol/lipid kinase family protein [Pirellulaceae bacterium]|jgi:diacylglycerol kinase (ATP)